MLSSTGEIGMGDVDEIAAEEDEIGLEAIGGFGDVIEHFLGGKNAGMNIGNEGDGETVQAGGEVFERQIVSFDAEASELGDADAAKRDAGEGRGREGGGGEKCSAGNGSGRRWRRNPEGQSAYADRFFGLV